jgi:hypothetical protein
VAKNQISDFNDLDTQIWQIGYRRTGDWSKMPGVGGMASVEMRMPPRFLVIRV